MSQFRVDWIILNAGLLGFTALGWVSLLAPKLRPGKSLWRERNGKRGKRMRESTCTQRNKREGGERRKREKKRPKHLVYIGKSLWEKGSPAPRLESPGLGAGYAR